MLKKTAFPLILMPLLIPLSIVVKCVLPDNPQAPEKTSFEILLESSMLNRNAFSIEDSVGKQLHIGAVCFLPENFATLAIKVTPLTKEVLLDSTIETFSTEYLYDTVWVPVTFFSSLSKECSHSGSYDIREGFTERSNSHHTRKETSGQPRTTDFRQWKTEPPAC